MYGRAYTQEQIEFLRCNAPGTPYAGLTSMFNSRFDEAKTVQQIRAVCNRRKIQNGESGHFQKGSIPFNKGRKGVRVSQATEFKKGNKPWNYKPIGTERISAYGYLEVKIADPKTWRAKHVLAWESKNGPVPKGHVVVFGDGDRMNLSPENLVLISRGELAVMNKRGLVGGSAELTETGRIIANIYMVANRRK